MQVVSAQRSSGWTQQPKFDQHGRPRCFQCNAYGHFAVECHSKPAVAKPKTEVDWVGALTQQQELKLVESTIDRKATVCGSIGGHSCKNILLDTGATQTVVKRELVDPHYFTGEHKVARSVNGIQQSFPPSIDQEWTEQNMIWMCWWRMSCAMMHYWDMTFQSYGRLARDYSMMTSSGWYKREATKRATSRTHIQTPRTQRSAV